MFLNSATPSVQVGNALFGSATSLPTVTLSETIGRWSAGSYWRLLNAFNDVLESIRTRSQADWLLPIDQELSRPSTESELIFDGWPAFLGILAPPIEWPGVTDRIEVDLQVRPNSILEQNIQEMQALTSLSQTDLAEQMLGVSRQSLSAWLSGTRTIRRRNLERVTESLEILRLAARYRAMPQDLQAWLFTPVTGRAIRPIDLLRSAEFDEVRMLATISLSQIDRALDAPNRARPINAWSARHEWARSSGTSDERAPFEEFDTDD